MKLGAFTWAGMVLVTGCKFSSAISSSEVDAAEPNPDPDAAVALDGPRTDWWDSRWHARHLITIDTTKLSGPVTDFPVLVRIRNTDVVAYPMLGPNGAAIRFAEMDHVTVIQHEIDTFVANGPSFVWIKVSLDPAQSPKRLYLYHDNAMATTSSNPAAVFGSYVSVQHLGTGGFVDASGHNHTATTQNGGSTPSSVVANVGRASSFDNNDFLELPTEADFDFTTDLGVSAWIRIDQFDTDYQAVIAKGDFAWRMQRAATSRFGQFGTNSSQNIDGAQIIDDNAWHHVAITLNNGTKRLYIDGAQVAMATGSADITNTAYTVRLGQNQEAGDMALPGGLRTWQGQLDEVRIGSLNRSAEWIRAEYVTVNDPALVTIGAVETY